MFWPLCLPRQNGFYFQHVSQIYPSSLSYFCQNIWSEQQEGNRRLGQSDIGCWDTVLTEVQILVIYTAMEMNYKERFYGEVF